MKKFILALLAAFALASAPLSPVFAADGDKTEKPAEGGKGGDSEPDCD